MYLEDPRHSQRWRSMSTPCAQMPAALDHQVFPSTRERFFTPPLGGKHRNVQYYNMMLSARAYMERIRNMTERITQTHLCGGVPRNAPGTYRNEEVSFQSRPALRHEASKVWHLSIPYNTTPASVRSQGRAYIQHCTCGVAAFLYVAPRTGWSKGGDQGERANCKRLKAIRAK